MRRRMSLMSVSPVFLVESFGRGYCFFEDAKSFFFGGSGTGASRAWLCAATPSRRTVSAVTCCCKAATSLTSWFFTRSIVGCSCYVAWRSCRYFLQVHLDGQVAGGPAAIRGQDGHCD